MKFEKLLIGTLVTIIFGIIKASNPRPQLIQDIAQDSEFDDASLYNLVRTGEIIASELNQLYATKLFILAIDHDNYEYARELFESSDVDSELCLEHLFLKACEKGYMDTIDSLISEGVDVRMRDDEPLMTAVETGNLWLLDKLIASGVDVRARDGLAYFLAARNGNIEMFTSLSRHVTVPGSQINPLFLEAVIHGQLSFIQFMLDFFDDFDWDYNEAVVAAAANGNLPILQFLLRNNFIGSDQMVSDALFEAAEHGKLEIVRYLINNFDIDIDKMQQAFLIAKGKELTSIIEILNR